MEAHRRGRGAGPLAGLEVHAGHGLDYATAEKIASLGEIAELNIGYFMMGEALFVGLGRRFARCVLRWSAAGKRADKA